MKRANMTFVERREQVFNFIKDFMKREGYGPSFKEIADGVGLSSISSVSHQIRYLEDEGRISRPAGKNRAYVIHEEVGVGERRER